MKRILILLISALFSIVANAQLTTAQLNQVRGIVKLSVDSVRSEYKSALLNQATDSSKATSLISRIKAIESYNKASALYPDSTLQITGNKIGVSTWYLTNLQNGLQDVRQSLTDLGNTVGTNNAEFIKLKARIDNLQLIFTIK